MELPWYGSITPYTLSVGLGIWHPISFPIILDKVLEELYKTLTKLNDFHAEFFFKTRLYQNAVLKMKFYIILTFIFLSELQDSDISAVKCREFQRFNDTVSQLLGKHFTVQINQWELWNFLWQYRQPFQFLLVFWRKKPLSFIVFYLNGIWWFHL